MAIIDLPSGLQLICTRKYAPEDSDRPADVRHERYTMRFLRLPGTALVVRVMSCEMQFSLEHNPSGHTRRWWQVDVWCGFSNPPTTSHLIELARYGFSERRTSMPNCYHWQFSQDWEGPLLPFGTVTDFLRELLEGWEHQLADEFTGPIPRDEIMPKGTNARFQAEFPWDRLPMFA